MLGVDQAHRYADHRDMLEKEQLDFVDIAAPHYAHRQLVLDAAAAGRHILLEKPMAVSVEEADEMLEAVGRAGIVFAVIHNYWYSPASAGALRLVREGAIGTPFAVRSEGMGGGHYPGTAGYDPDWRTKSHLAGGGCLIDNGYHNTYLARHMMTSPVKRVMASMGTHLHPIDVDDTAFVLMEHENGGTSSIQVAWSVRAGGQGVNEVHGTEGSLHFGREGKPFGLFRDGEWRFPDCSLERTGFEGVFYGFAQALAGKGEVPTTGEEARENLRVVLAAYQSAREHRVVEL
jgi:predicted dehydrogenase